MPPKCTGYVCTYIQEPIVISGISVAVKSYRVNYFNSATGDVCGPAAELSLANENTACTSSDLCKVRHDLTLPESCSNDNISVTVSATSVLGTGPPMQPLRIGWCSIKHIRSNFMMLDTQMASTDL